MSENKRNITTLLDKFRGLKERRNIIQEMIETKTAKVIQIERSIVNNEKARALVQEVAKNIQDDLEYKVTNIVTMALSSVFPDPYEFKIRFVNRRNQTECDLLFVKNGNECDPMDSSGGGAIDIASLALRMAVWSIRKTRAIQILDEPAKYVSRDLQDKVSEVIKRLSSELGIQMIIVSHIPEMINAADRVFNVEQVDGVSTLKMVR